MLDAKAKDKVIRALFQQVIKNGLGKPFTLCSLAESCFEQIEIDDGFAYDASGIMVTEDELDDIDYDFEEYAVDHGIYLHEESWHHYTPHKRAKPWKVSRDMTVTKLTLLIGGFMGPEFSFTYEPGSFRYSEIDCDRKPTRDAVVYLDEKGMDGFRRILDDNGVFKWERDYYEPICDGTQWRLLVFFDNGAAYVSGGSNGFPDSLGVVTAEFSRLIAGNIILNHIDVPHYTGEYD